MGQHLTVSFHLIPLFLPVSFCTNRCRGLDTTCVKQEPVAADWPGGEDGGHSSGHPGWLWKLQLGDQLSAHVQWQWQELEAVPAEGEHPGRSPSVITQESEPCTVPMKLLRPQMEEKEPTEWPCHGSRVCKDLTHTVQWLSRRRFDVFLLFSGLPYSLPFPHFL
jgi:hypothetical protein